MLARILYLSCIRYNHCRVCATWLERDVSLPGCMRIKSVTQYRLSSLQPPRCSSAISQIQTNDPSPPSLPLRTCILSPTTSASESSGMWYLLRHVGNLAQTSSSIQTPHELLRIGTHISGGPAARTISEPSADFMSAPPQAPTRQAGAASVCRKRSQRDKR